MVQFKQSVLVALTLLASTPVDVISFTPSSSISNSGATFKTTQLEATKNNNNENRVVGGATAFVTGLVLATQVAFADASTLVDNSMPAAAFQEESTQSSSVILSAFGAPSSGVGGSFETLDFSLPSYSEATKGSSAKPADDAPPAFTPSFTELKLPEPSAPAKEEKVVDEAKVEADKKAEEEAKAAAKKKAEEDKAAAKKADEEAKAAEKAAKEKAKEEEKIAKEKEAAEKAAAAEKKKAEIEARKQAEKEKQEEMLKRNKEAAEKAAAVEAEKPITNVVVPPSPPSVPEVDEIKLPEIKIPSFSAPKFEVPTFEAPSPPPAPKVVEAPPAPKIVTPPPPTFSTPPPPAAPVQEVKVIKLEPQEVRDERARDAKIKFKDLDAKAKDLEEQAKDARRLATGAKKEAEIAKAEACETRPGGKFICVRPFGIGY